MSPFNTLVLSLIACSQGLQPPQAVPCLTSTDCDEFTNATCSTSGFCVCPDENQPCRNQPSTPINQIGESCAEPARNCIIPYSECVAGVCVCQQNFTASINQKKCLPIEKLLNQCEETPQCPKPTVCLNHTCVCPENTHLLEDNCYPNRQLNEKCELDAECSQIDNSVCRKGSCKCSLNYTEDHGRCLEQKGLDEECERSVQCTGILGYGAYCSHGKCQCQELFHFNGNKCVKDYLLDEICEKDEECHQPGHGASRLECLLGVCKCRDQFWEVHGYCVEKSAGLQVKATFILVVIVLFFKL